MSIITFFVTVAILGIAAVLTCMALLNAQAKRYKKTIFLIEEKSDEKLELAEKYWAPGFKHGDPVGYYHAIGVSDQRAQELKNLSVTMMMDYVRHNKRFSEVIQLALSRPDLTKAEHLILYQDIVMLYRLAGGSLPMIFEVRTELIRLLETVNPTHPIVKAANRSSAGVRIVDSSSALEVTLRDLFKDMARARANPKKPEDTKEPEENLHAKADDPDSMISKL
jgi:hypothetical protein